MKMYNYIRSVQLYTRMYNYIESIYNNLLITNYLNNRLHELKIHVTISFFSFKEFILKIKTGFRFVAVPDLFSSGGSVTSGALNRQTKKTMIWQL